MTRIGIIGIGAVGGVVAAHLTRAGERVEVICKHDGLAQLVTTRGIRVHGVSGAYTVPLDAKPRLNQLSSPQDVVFLATKANDALDATKALVPYLHENSVVVTLQNGIVEDAVGEIVGRGRVIGCIVHWGSTVNEPGEIEQTSHGLFIVGELDGSLTNRLQVVKRLLEHTEPVSISRNIRGALYTKLVINSCITSLGAICGLFLGRMLRMKKARELFLGICNEAVAVAGATDLEPEKIERLDLYRLAGKPSLGKHLMLRLIGLKYRKIKSSSLQSLEKGRPTEIDYLNGYIVRRGEAEGVDTPINRIIHEMVKEIEEGRRQITPANIDELFERRWQTIE